MHSDKKRRTKRQHSNVLNDDMNSESESSCESKIGHFSSLTGAEAVHSNKNKECKDNILMCQMIVNTVKVRAVVILKSVNPHLCQVQQKLLGMVVKSDQLPSWSKHINRQ